MAKAILNRAGTHRFRAPRAESFPSGEVNPRTIELLGHLDHPFGELRSKSWAEIAATFAGPCRMLNDRIGIFVNLPAASLDKLTLQERLDEIGERKADVPE